MFFLSSSPSSSCICSFSSFLPFFCIRIRDCVFFVFVSRRSICPDISPLWYHRKTPSNAPCLAPSHLAKRAELLTTTSYAATKSSAWILGHWRDAGAARIGELTSRFSGQRPNADSSLVKLACGRKSHSFTISIASFFSFLSRLPSIASIGLWSSYMSRATGEDVSTQSDGAAC